MRRDKYKKDDGSVMSTVFKVSSWHMKLKAIGLAIFGLIVFVYGIVIFISTGALGLLAFSVIGLVMLLGSWLY